MAKRPAHTLLLLASDRTARIDLGPGPEFERIAERQMPPGGSEDPVVRAGSALALGGTVGKQVWILWDGAWTQTLEMPAAAVAGLTPEQLARSLAFEIEPLSGLPAGEASALGVAPLPSADPNRQAFWIVQVAAPIRDALETTVRSAGGRLAGIAHPSGLPQPAWGGMDRPAGEWRRVEVWDQATAIVAGNGHGSPSVRIVNARAGSAAWRNEMPTAGPVGWMARMPAPEIVSDDGTPVEWTPGALPADVVPTEWLKAWARELTAKPRRVPAAEPKPGPAGSGLLIAVGAGLTAAVLALCVLHGSSLSRQAEDLKEKADRIESDRALLTKAFATSAKNAGADSAKVKKDDAAELEKLKHRTAELQKTEEELTKHVTAAQSAAAERKQRVERLAALKGAQREAFSALLTALAAIETPKVAVKDVRLETGGKLKMTGICAGQRSANEFAEGLKGRLAPAGWSVEPAQTRLHDVVAGADGRQVEIYAYSILLAPPASAAPPAPAAPGQPAPVAPVPKVGPHKAAPGERSPAGRLAAPAARRAGK